MLQKQIDSATVAVESLSKDLSNTKAELKTQVERARALEAQSKVDSEKLRGELEALQIKATQEHELSEQRFGGLKSIASVFEIRKDIINIEEFVEVLR